MDETNLHKKTTLIRILDPDKTASRQIYDTDNYTPQESRCNGDFQMACCFLKVRLLVGQLEFLSSQEKARRANTEERR